MRTAMLVRILVLTVLLATALILDQRALNQFESLNERSAIVESLNSHNDQSPIHVVYCVQNLVLTMPRRTQLLNPVVHMLRGSILSLIKSSSESTLSSLTIYLLETDNGKDLPVLESLRDDLIGEFPVKINVMAVDPSIVTTERTVWGNIKKLESTANYIRFYLPVLLADISHKFMYIDYDVMFSGDIAHLYHNYANGDVALAAGVQNPSNCDTKKIFADLSDPRLKNVPLKPDEPCIASGIMLMNAEVWESQKRTKEIEHWLAKNKEKMLWWLGSLPPLMVAFAGGQYQGFPIDQVGDNKAYLISRSWEEGRAKNFTMVHPAKLHNYVQASQTWFQVVISTEHDMMLLPHVLKHYQSLMIPRSRFLVILHNKDENAALLKEAHRITQEHGVFNIMHWIGDYSSPEMFQHRKMIRNLAKVEDNDWVIHADSDQLHEFPVQPGARGAPAFLEMVANMGYDAVYGYYQDRVARNGIIRNITATPSLFEQFPLSCHISTQIVKLNRKRAEKNIPGKVMAFKGRLSENNGGGKLLDENQGCVFPARLRTHHFKWTWAVIAKMELRATSEQDTPYGYQSTNVLNYLKKTGGVIDVEDERLRCSKQELLRDVPASPVSVSICQRHNWREVEMTRVNR